MIKQNMRKEALKYQNENGKEEKVAERERVTRNKLTWHEVTHDVVIARYIVFMLSFLSATYPTLP